MNQNPSNLIIGLFSDHAGYTLKEDVKKQFHTLNLIDYGTHTDQRVDYPEFGKRAAKKLNDNSINYAFLFCGSGIGITIAANRFHQVRAFVAHSTKEAELARKHNNANAISFSGRFQKIETIIPFIEIFLSTDFENGRHTTRIQQLDQ